MVFEDIIDSGRQPSRWSLGWQRLNLVRAMARTKRTGNTSRLRKQYQEYLAQMVEVVGAQLTADSDFLSLDPQARMVRISRLIQRSLDAENTLRKEVVDIFQQLIVTPIWDRKWYQLYADLYRTATQHHLQSGVRLQRYPSIDPALIEEAIATAQRQTVLKIVKSCIEPSIQQELRTLKKQSEKQLYLRLSYRN